MSDTDQSATDTARTVIYLRAHRDELRRRRVLRERLRLIFDEAGGLDPEPKPNASSMSIGQLDTTRRRSGDFQ